jgi:hypothetical protein
MLASYKTTLPPVSAEDLLLYVLPYYVGLGAETVAFGGLEKTSSGPYRRYFCHFWALVFRSLGRASGPKPSTFSMHDIHPGFR